MTYSHNSTLPEALVAQIAEQGFEYLPELIRIMINTAMQAERQKYLAVGPYERSQERRDYANGYKPKTMKTRMGEKILAGAVIGGGVIVATAAASVG